MNASERCLNLIKDFEKCVLIAYRDGKGVWTIGWGHTGPEVQKGCRWSKSEADATFERDIGWAEAAVNRLVTTVINQNQFDALVSFVFNIGVSNFKLSTLLRKVNGRDFVGAQAQFPKWNKVTDPTTGHLRVENGLNRRRAVECALFNLKEPS